MFFQQDPSGRRTSERAEPRVCLLWCSACPCRAGDGSCDASLHLRPQLAIGNRQVSRTGKDHHGCAMPSLPVRPRAHGRPRARRQRLRQRMAARSLDWCFRRGNHRAGVRILRRQRTGVLGGSAGLGGVWRHRRDRTAVAGEHRLRRRRSPPRTAAPSAARHAAGAHQQRPHHRGGIRAWQSDHAERRGLPISRSSISTRPRRRT